MQHFLHIVVWIILLLFHVPARADHIVGGEMSYRCLEQGRYEITLKMYRDCYGGGAPFDSQYPGSIVGTVTVYRGADNTPFIPTIELDTPEVQKVETRFMDPCLVLPPEICIEEGTYTFTLELPPSDQSYHIVYQRCCRDHGIRNIVLPHHTGATFAVEISPIAQELCNNSPVFGEYPNTISCIGDSVQFDLSATDPDGNTELVYSFCNPLDGAGVIGFQGYPGSFTQLNGFAPNPDAPPPYNGVNFGQPSYAFDRPLGQDPPIEINSLTGEIKAMPKFTGRYLLGVCVKEYLNGELLSVVRRDIQLFVSACEPKVFAKVKADRKKEDNTYVVRSCGDQTVALINESFNVDYIDRYLWKFDIEGAIETFDRRDVTVQFPGFGTYFGQMIVNPGGDCADTAEIEIQVFPGIDADFTMDYDSCSTAPVEFFDQSQSAIGQILSWDWTFGDGTSHTAQNPVHNYQQPGERPVTLEVRDSNQCTDRITKYIPYYPSPEQIRIQPTTYRACAPARIQFEPTISPFNEDYVIRWDFGNGGTSTDFDPSHTFEQPDSYSIGIELTSPIGCRSSKTYDDLISILERPRADFSYNPQPVNSFQPEVQFTDQSSHANGWQWTFSGEDVAFGQNPIHRFSDTGKHRVTLIAFHPNGCTDSVTRLIDVVPVATYYLPNAFTPNGDGKNDEYLGKGIMTGIEDFELTIWNRYGEKIFETNDPQEGWKGRAQRTGQPVPSGVYVCIVEYTGPRGKHHRLKEFATLIR